MTRLGLPRGGGAALAGPNVGEPAHRPAPEHEAKAQAWLDRVRDPQPVDLDALNQADDEQP